MALSTVISKAVVKITAEDRASRKLKEVGTRFESINKKMQFMMKGALIAGAGFAVGIGVKAVRAAAQFETVMTEVSTLLSGDAMDSMEILTKRVKAMAKSFPQTPEELGAGLYDIISASVKGVSNQMFVLETAAKAATGGLSDTRTAADAITTILNAYGLEATEATKVSDVMFQTIKRGKTTFNELAPTIGRVTAIAAQTGVEFEELGALMAFLTRNGIQTDMAITGLRQVMVSILKPTKEATDAADELGISFDSETLKAKGLIPFLAELIEKTEGNDDAVVDLFGNVRALTAFMPLMGDGIVEVQEDLDAMTNSTGSADEAFQKMNETAEAQWKILKNKLNIELGNLGDIIIPKLIGAYEGWQEWLDKNYFVFTLLPDILKENIEKLETIEKWVLRVALGFGSVFVNINDAKEVLEDIKSVIDKVSNAFGRLKGKIGELFNVGFSFGELKNVLGFQHGGAFTVNKPTMFMAGEHGTREDVIVRPHTQGRTQAGTGNTYNIHIDPHMLVVNNQGDVQRIAQEVKRVLSRDLELAGWGASVRAPV